MQALTLYDVEDNLRALLESAAMVEDQPPLAAALFSEIEKTNAAGREKRDNWARFILTLKRAAQMQRDEANRLLDKARSIDRLRARASERLLAIIDEFAPEPTGKLKSKRLVGDVHSLCAELNSVPSVIVDDPEKVPDNYKSVTVTIPLLEYLKIRPDSDGVECHLDHQRIRQDLLDNQPVPGARLERAKHLKIR